MYYCTYLSKEIMRFQGLDGLKKKMFNVNCWSFILISAGYYFYFILLLVQTRKGWFFCGKST